MSFRLVAGQHESAMRIVATDQHQQPVFLRHVDEVGTCDDSIPILGDDLKSRGKPELSGRTVKLADFMRFPIR